MGSAMNATVCGVNKHRACFVSLLLRCITNNYMLDTQFVNGREEGRKGGREAMNRVCYVCGVNKHRA